MGGVRRGSASGPMGEGFLNECRKRFVVLPHFCGRDAHTLGFREARRTAPVPIMTVSVVTLLPRVIRSVAAGDGFGAHAGAARTGVSVFDLTHPAASVLSCCIAVIAGFVVLYHAVTAQRSRFGHAGTGRSGTGIACIGGTPRTATVCIGAVAVVALLPGFHRAIAARRCEETDKRAFGGGDVGPVDSAVTVDIVAVASQENAAQNIDERYPDFTC